jgi:Rrf2 family protein
MQITRQADYAVRAVLYLAGLENEGRAPTRQIARKGQIPPSFLAKIVSQLSVAGVVLTSRGARGGVSLARSSNDISLLEVIEAIDGPIYLNVCVGDHNLCSMNGECAVYKIWCEAQEALVERLASTYFDKLVAM